MTWYGWEDVAIVKVADKLVLWGNSNTDGQLGLGNVTNPGGKSEIFGGGDWSGVQLSNRGGQSTRMDGAIKSDGTLWSWGYNVCGVLGQNQAGTGVNYSSPVQIPGTTWTTVSNAYGFSGAVKSDGTLWTWGRNDRGNLAQNSVNTPAYAGISSPVQVPGTTWQQYSAGSHTNCQAGAIKKI